MRDFLSGQQIAAIGIDARQIPVFPARFQSATGNPRERLGMIPRDRSGNSGHGRVKALRDALVAGRLRGQPLGATKTADPMNALDQKPIERKIGKAGIERRRRMAGQDA